MGRNHWVLLLSAAGIWAQTVKITWVGQACFVVQSEGGPNVIADPPAANIGYPLPQLAADAVLVTHNHGDHNNVAGVRGSPAVVDGRPTTERAEMSAAGLPFVLIPGFHDNQNGAARGRNTIVQWTQAGLRFAHFGDYGQDALTDAQLADLRDLDIVFVPAGGFFTIDAQQAAALVNQLRPRVTIPMHYRTALGGPAQLAGLPAAASPFGAVVYKPSSVTTGRDRLPASREVWVMEPAADSAVVNAAGFRASAVAPGSLASVFGTFSGAATLAASQAPLPRRLGETELLIQDVAAPLLFASGEQINFQVPRALAPGQYPVDVRVAGQRVGRTSVTVIPRAPGLFVATAPVRRGDIITIYGTGQGEVTNAPEDGSTAPANPLAFTTATPEVTIGGRPATVRFSGLAPGFVGLWQINAAIPGDAPVGAAVPLVVAYGSASGILSVAVQ
jgi:uncharacterized protein (TIGR03437 family)